jgi:hypothetical protein
MAIDFSKWNRQAGEKALEQNLSKITFIGSDGTKWLLQRAEAVYPYTSIMICILKLWNPPVYSTHDA